MPSLQKKLILNKQAKLQLYPTKHTYHLKVVGSIPSWGTTFF